MKKILILDFCNTLVRTDSYPRFIKFLFYQLSPLRSIVLRTLFYLRVYLKLKKGLELHALSGLSTKEFNQICQKFSKELNIHTNKEVLNFAKDCANDGYSIIVLSGALSNYIECYLNVISLESLVIAKRIDETKESISLDSKEFIFGPIKLEEFKKNIKINRNSTKIISMGDSFTDLDILSYADEKIVMKDSDKALLAIAKEKSWRIL